MYTDKKKKGIDLPYIIAALFSFYLYKEIKQR